MNNQHLKKTLQLIRRTGDKGIIIDEESDELFVLMDVKAYEKMLPPMMAQAVNTPSDDSHLDEPSDNQVLNELIESEERSQAPVVSSARPQKSPVSLPVRQKTPPMTRMPAPPELNFSEDWSPKQDAVSNEESLADVPHDGEEEEKFYLEPVA